MCEKPINLTNPISRRYGRNADTYEINKNPFIEDWLIVPCGKCKECLQQKSIEWSYRICDEAKLHSQNCYITLTYENAPRSLSKEDFQKFIKDLREYLRTHYGLYIRYFGSGEYGDLKGRPHYHLIIFGWCPSDIEYFFTNENGDKIFKSKEVAKIWKKGFITVGEVTLQSAKYVALYLQKLEWKDDGRVPPFQLMSKRPGIGFGAIKKESIVTDKIYVNGKYIKIPRYYLKVLERDGVNLYDLKCKRLKNMLLYDEINHRFHDDYVKAQANTRKFKSEKKFVKKY